MVQYCVDTRKMVGNCLLVLLFFKLCYIETFEFSREICHLDGGEVGRCVPVTICPQVLGETKHFSDECDTGDVCCRISAKIVTPNNGNSVPPFPVAAQPVPQNAPATIPPQSVSGSGSPPNSFESNSPSENTPVEPLDSAETPSGPPPALIGNIVADPGVPQKSLPPPEPDYDTIVVSAEEMNNAIDIVDRKCERYHSIIQTETAIRPVRGGSFTPIVMIYGGVDSEEKEFPHMAALGYGNQKTPQWLCGGSLITENFVITAAHCLSAQPLGEVQYVKLGNVRVDQANENTQIMNVVRRIPHEQYNPLTQYNDIALLQLERMVRITVYVTPICLFSSTNYEDKNLIATGWGKTESGAPSANLLKVGLELFTQTECDRAYGLVSKQQLPQGIQQDIQLCAGSHSENKDTCQGDSGGPLQIRKNNRWYLIGITSIGIRCGMANTPGIYTRVAHYIQWIQSYVWNK